MRTPRIFIALVGLALAYPVATLGGSFDAGLIVGDPTGLSFKGWLNDSSAFDAAVSWTSDSQDKRYIHGDFLRHDYTLIPVTRGELPVYYGIGARIQDQNNRDTKVGIRIPVGVDYLLDTLPLSLFAEIVPTLDLTPDTDFELDAAIGIRYRFMSNTNNRNTP